MDALRLKGSRDKKTMKIAGGFLLANSQKGLLVLAIVLCVGCIGWCLYAGSYGSIVILCVAISGFTLEYQLLSKKGAKNAIRRMDACLGDEVDYTVVMEETGLRVQPQQKPKKFLRVKYADVRTLFETRKGFYFIDKERHVVVILKEGLEKDTVNYIRTYTNSHCNYLDKDKKIRETTQNPRTRR